MNNKIILHNIEVNNNMVNYDFTIEGDFKKYFNIGQKYFMQYSENVESVPYSILAIPFVTNLIPMCWIFDATMELKELDKDFYESIFDFKKGYENMYPMLNLNGNVNVNNIVENKNYSTENTGCFFSGGLDAFSTLITNIDKKPLLINLQGSDIELQYSAVLDNMKKQIKETAANFGLEATFIKSSFRKILNEKRINRYIKPIAKDNYWHGFQHGIAIIGHAAPIAFNHKLKTIYIAASFTEGDNVTCASDPTIDNFVKLSSTSIFHDGYEMSRIDKSDNIGSYLIKNNKKINIRVCLDDYRTDNCCNCEKCFRTIYGFIAMGYDPSIVGINVDESIHKKIKQSFKYRILLGHTRHWDKIKGKISSDLKLSSEENLKWITKYDFDNCNNHIIKYIVKIYFALKKRFLYLTRLVTKAGK